MADFISNEDFVNEEIIKEDSDGFDFEYDGTASEGVAPEPVEEYIDDSEDLVISNTYISPQADNEYSLDDIHLLLEDIVYYTSEMADFESHLDDIRLYNENISDYLFTLIYSEPIDFPDFVYYSSLCNLSIFVIVFFWFLMDVFRRVTFNLGVRR